MINDIYKYMLDPHCLVRKDSADRMRVCKKLRLFRMPTRKVMKLLVRIYIEDGFSCEVCVDVERYANKSRERAEVAKRIRYVKDSRTKNRGKMKCSRSVY